MEIAHEAPLSIMKEIRTITDYDYCLVHLLNDPEIGKSYEMFFRESLLMGRKVLLDNSVFELEEAIDFENFSYWIRKLQPTEFIIPDVLEDCDKTIDNILEWTNLYPELGTAIGVVQGKTYDELVRCYEYIEYHCDKIAISFDYSWYKEICPHSNKLYSYMYGRQYLIDKLIADKIINRNKSHHLLGCSLPQEFRHYKSDGYDFIKSMDTSNPVVHGLEKLHYQVYGLESKHSQKLFTMIKNLVDYSQFEIIVKNIKQFRNFISY